MKHKFFIVALAAFAALTSCEVTNLTPSDSLNDATYWKSTNDLKLYANSFYGSLGGAVSTHDAGTDIRLYNSPNSFYAGLDPVPDADGNWSFGTLRNANYFLNRYQKVKGDESVINHYVAEVRFFRAVDVWWKVMRYGAFPWYDKDLQTTDTELIYKGRDSRAFVLGKIIEDLEFACRNLLSKKDVDKNRIYNFVAYAQLARVCLYEGTRAKYAGDNTIDANAMLTKAATAAKYIIDNGGYSIVMDTNPFTPAIDNQHPLNYYALFTQLGAITNNPECILAREYKQDLLTHNMTREMSETGTGLSKFMANQYLCTDGLPISVSPLYKGDNTLSLEMENRDRRMYQTIDNKFLPYQIKEDGLEVHEFPPIGGTTPTGYTFMKFHHTDPNQWIANNCWTQWYLYRYAETLLIYAEAQAELGLVTQDDIDLTINKLRLRAGVAPLNIGNIATDPAWPNYGHAISPVLQEIRRERLVELVGEGFRNDDIIRWRAGKLLENPLVVYGCPVTTEMMAHYPAGTFDLTGNTGGTGVPTVVYKGKRYIRIHTKEAADGYLWNDRFYLHPVPKEQLSLNPKLAPQNQGWE